MEPHFIYAGGYRLYLHFYVDPEHRRRSFFRELMKKYQIKTVMMSIIYMKKNRLITKEKMISYCKGENEIHQMSINDDLEAMFEDLKLGERPSYSNQTYFLPKLTEHEMALAETADKNYFQTFYDGVYGAKNPDVNEDEMRMSESKSKFIHGDCQRKTYRIGINVWERNTKSRVRKIPNPPRNTKSRERNTKSLPEPKSRCSIQ